MRRLRPRTILFAAFIAVAALLLWNWQRNAAEEQRRAEEIATAEGVAQVLRTAFAGQTDLRVAQVRGTIDVTSVDQGPLFRTTQRGTLPFSVDYFVDLSKLDQDSTQFDGGTRTLTVEVPQVRVAEPNIDLAKGKMGTAEGWWVSRRASASLIQRSVKLAHEQAVKTANEPQQIERARTEARTRIQNLMGAPLAAAGYGDVKVVARFKGEPGARPDPSFIDHSRSYNEVLEEAARNRL